jgi:hypothetical protein
VEISTQPRRKREKKKILSSQQKKGKRTRNCDFIVKEKLLRKEKKIVLEVQEILQQEPRKSEKRAN